MNKIKKKKIFFISGSRSEYGQFSLLLKKLSTTKKINFKLIITGMHLYEKFGKTYKEAIKDQIKIYKRIKIDSNVDNDFTIPNSFSLTVKKFTGFLIKEKPDLVILPGDRYEILAVAISCFFQNIPVVHFYGGDTSLGSQDEFFRNSISNIAKYHFVSHNLAKKKIIKKNDILKKFIFNYGALSLDNINKSQFFTKKIVEKKIDINLNFKTILLTYHPITVDQKVNRKEIDILLKSLKKLKNINIVFTYPNNDKGHDYIINRIQNFCKTNSKKYKFYKSLGRKLYFSLIQYSKLIIGNSSSLLYEVPYLRRYSLNVGLRQKGRIFGNTVVNISSDRKDISNIIYKYLKKDNPKHVTNPYYVKNSTKKILNKLFKIIENI